MFLDAMKIRIGMILVGIILVGVYFAAGGRIGAGDRGVIQIEYGAYRDDFQGLTVEIDGKAAGTLHGFGPSTRKAFAVSEGDHAVRIIHPHLPSEMRMVKVGAGHTVMLILDEHMALDGHGREREEIAFQN
jgi:hypothetical protein